MSLAFLFGPNLGFPYIGRRNPGISLGRRQHSLRRKLAARSRHVCLLIGAGAGKSAGHPDLADLRHRVLSDMDGEAATAARGLLEHRDVEAGLTRLHSLSRRALADVAVDGHG